MSPAPARARLDGSPSLSAGYLAALPLFLVYELGLSAQGAHGARAAAEQVVGRALSLFGERAQWARLALLAAAGALAWVRLRDRDGAGARAGELALAGQVLQGVLAGLLLGPLLALLQVWLHAAPPPETPEPARTLPAVLRLVGAAPWEELFFRVGIYGALFLVVRHASGFLGLHAGPARAGAELLALLGAALLFALFHLDALQRLIGSAGEPYHSGLFLWRVSAGILLAALFRWRGFGVASWAHATFNLGIALGLGPL
jgi:hypothetical protein